MNGKGELSLPMRGAWIEICNRQQSKQFAASLPMRGAWIEIILLVAFLSILVSLPMRGAWIEITRDSGRLCSALVAPHAGSVD